MDLYLIRHGIAVDPGFDITDNERTLTKEGRQKTEKVAKRLLDLGVLFNLMVTSPLVRSRQTAEILTECGLSSQLEESRHLAPDGDIQAWVSNWLKPRNYPADFQLAAVGHEPNLGAWAEVLVWGQARGGIVVKKAGIIGLTLPETASPIGRSQLFWLAPPKFLI